MSVRAKMSTQSTVGHPPQSKCRWLTMLGKHARPAVAPLELCDRCCGRRRLPRAASRQRASQSMIGPAQLPPRPREAKEPALAAAFTSVLGKLSPSEVLGRAGRCAGAPAMRRSCTRRRGGDGVASARRSHQKGDFLGVMGPTLASWQLARREIGWDPVTR